jgi:poly(A) polymerase
MSGRAERAWLCLAPTPLLTALFPACNPDDELVVRAMRNTDERIREDKPVTPGFLLAVLLWADFLARAADLGESVKPAEARLHAAIECLSEQQQIISIPRRFTQFIRDVWHLQQRLEARLPRTIERLAGHVRFRAAYDFLLLRAETGDDVGEAAAWWTSYQDAGPEVRQAMIDERRASTPQKKKRRRRSRKNRSEQSNVSPDPS